MLLLSLASQSAPSLLALSRMSSASQDFFELHNETNNFTLVQNEGGFDYHFTLSIATSVILGIMTLTTIIGKPWYIKIVPSNLIYLQIGNIFVIAAIVLERNLQCVANYLILSLAVADLLVAVLVMPLGAVYQVSFDYLNGGAKFVAKPLASSSLMLLLLLQISMKWTFGPKLCDMWTSSDVLCCTASILHLVAIAWDR